MNRFPSSRWASAIQIVRPSESTAETQPKLHPALLRLSAMIVIGKAFWDIGHAPKDQSNRRKYMPATLFGKFTRWWN
jgi:hypothetical protein